MSKIIDLDITEERIAAGASFVEMQALKQGAQNDLDQHRRKAEDLGFTAGYTEGRRDFLEQTQAVIDQVREHLMAQETALIEVVLRAVEKIVTEMPPIDRVQSILHRALIDIVDAQTVKIKAAPEDQQLVIEAVSRIALAPGLSPLQVSTDPLLVRGELLLETPLGVIHVGEKRQLARLEAAILRGASHQ
jgi:flagellar biosynthesis/type III secretory pathway protein FliH